MKITSPICLTEYQNEYHINGVQFFKNYLRPRNIICAAVPVISNLKNAPHYIIAGLSTLVYVNTQQPIHVLVIIFVELARVFYYVKQKRIKTYFFFFF